MTTITASNGNGLAIIAPVVQAVLTRWQTNEASITEEERVALTLMTERIKILGVKKRRGKKRRAVLKRWHRYEFLDGWATYIRATTGIDWTVRTWNPFTGCLKISPGCKFCYADLTATVKSKSKKSPYFGVGFKPTFHPKRLLDPQTWKEPSIVFTCSMSDIFLDVFTDQQIKMVFDAMAAAHWHIFQVLTKRPERMVDWIRRHYPEGTFPRNIWLGVSVENQEYVWRIEYLVQTPATVKFVSFEPLLGPIVVPSALMSQLGWSVVGGESGFQARPMDLDWARSLRDQLLAHGVPCFFKQVGGNNSKSGGRLLDGRTWDQIPLPTWWLKLRAQWEICEQAKFLKKNGGLPLVGNGQEAA